MVEELQRRGYQKRPTELKLTLKDGRQFYAETKESVIYRDGKPHAILGIARDITERKHAEENLRKSEEKYRRIIENIDEGYSETTMDGVLLFCNESFCRIFGYSREELRTMCFRDFAAPEDAGRLFNAFREMYRSGMPLTMENYNVVHKDGSIRRLEMTASVMHDAAGTPIGARSMLRDVTQRKTSDEEREKLKKQLFQAQKLEAIGTLAGGIAHDFNNILASIMGYTELAMRDTLKEKRKKYLSQVLNSCERARNLIQHILTFSRQQEQERKPVDIKAIIKESLKMLRSSLPTTIQIEQKIDAPSSTVFADPTELHQIMMNLCTNAAHAMRAKNGTLKILLNNLAITQEMLSLNPDFQCGPHIQLTVGDTGHGIDPSIMDMIFDPFFTTKKQEEGTGLGLSVVYGIVKRYNGVITVQSDVGEGTIFNIYLPVVVEELPVREEIKDAAKLEGTGRILIVDDEEMLLLINQTFLSSLGYDVVAATGGQEALRLFAEDPGRYDLIITDMTMPQMTGMALSREVMAIRPDIPVILCTGYNESIIEEEAKAQGVKAFFMKPISLNALGRMVQQLLDR
jgi:PAS domain S-box-containing protein